MDKYVPIPDFPTDELNFEPGKDWTLKTYKTDYWTLEQRKQFTIEISIDYYDPPNKRFMLHSRVVNVIKNSDGTYTIICRNTKTNEETEIVAKHVVFGGGRFTPILVKKIGFIPMSFARIELGVRFEGPSTSRIFSASDNIDPKFMKYDPDTQIEYRTFCWCRDGETTCTDFNGIRTWSGRSDVTKTEVSNFGFNVRFKNQKHLHLIDDALSTQPFVTSYTNPDIPQTYRKIYDEIKLGLDSFVEHAQAKTGEIIDLTDFQIKGPTIEGVGYYPITDDDLRVPNENIWFVGDATGKFRGIFAALLSGTVVAQHLMELLN